jgi:hypothetical protein
MIWISINNGEKIKVTLKNREQLKERYSKEYPPNTPVEVIRYQCSKREYKTIKTLPLGKVFSYIKKCW